jgi:hypothetical protein
MRKTYHIRIDKEEEPSFTRFATHLGVKPETIIYMDVDVTDKSKGEIDFILKLSKYELLSMRLMCKGSIKEIEKANKSESFRAPV